MRTIDELEKKRLKAGNVLDNHQLGSIEYAVAHLPPATIEYE